jgi:hypothetical protein
LILTRVYVPCSEEILNPSVPMALRLSGILMGEPLAPFLLRFPPLLSSEPFA